jgi:Transposase DDE domain
VNSQPELLQPEHLSPRLRWEKLFAYLPSWPEPPSSQGRKPYQRDALLRSLIYQRLTRRRFLQDLRRQLLESPPLLAALGFNAYEPPPSLERFSSFLADTPNTGFQNIRIQLAQNLIKAGVFQGRHLGLDSCPVASWVRENNLKTSLRRSRFDKNTPPPGDPDARLGVRIHYPFPDKAEVQYFWGYRNHTLADLETELPLWETTQPNSVGEVTVAQPLLSSAMAGLDLHPESITADAEYDVESLLRYITQELKAKPFIAYNHRNDQNHAGFRREAQRVFCPANLLMYRYGRMTVKGVTYLQFRCPLYYGPRQEMLLCPVNHPKFNQQKGCNYLWRLTDSVRSEIPYGSDTFKEHYNRRTSIERIFSRLLHITIQEPSVRGLSSVRNHCTLSHIAVLLVALAAHQLGQSDKIRFVSTFVPEFLNAPTSLNPKK